MADKMDRGLDDIIADSRITGPRNRRGRHDGRRNERQDYPRDGVRKSARNDGRSIDSEWVHDRFHERAPRGGPLPRRRRDSPPSKGAKIRVENIHYDLGEDDLEELFARIGPVARLQLRYDRAGRSEGTAIVTYELKEDAQEAIRQFDGANANGQPIQLTLLSGGPSRNAFDTAVMPGRPLAERITVPTARSRSFSPRRRRFDEEDATRKGIDRYIPDEDSRPRSPMGQRRGGRRPGARREDQSSGRGGRDNGRSNPRLKKTQEELDAEMEDYFGGSSASAPTAPSKVVNGNDDIDMIE
ncbi:THO complex subunit 4A [Ophiocordyceps camponoti-floridani]|uniref:THO complex subunit 4A n=1 Tax=Ophiocordyceps camponoti-floridani TaxID=2030778 RepID=A0A8H4VG91_9HYPO|nr:THO complex subunit 4A [Ophiocordyceps camponoti-floridani]